MNPPNLRIPNKIVSFRATAHELSASEAAPMLRESVKTAGPVTRRVIAPYFSCDVDDPADHVGGGIQTASDLRPERDTDDG